MTRKSDNSRREDPPTRRSAECGGTDSRRFAECGDTGQRRFAERGGTTRRRFLERSFVVAGVAGIGATGSASAAGVAGATQGDDVLTEGVIPEQEVFDQSVTGFFVHLGENLDPTDATVDEECAFLSWPSDRLVAFDAQLLDRQADPEQTSVTLYLHEAVEVAPGTLFIVNSVEPCGSEYQGLMLERIGTDIADLRGGGLGATGPTDGAGDAPAGATEEEGPGVGVVGTVATFLGVGWLLDRARRR